MHTIGESVALGAAAVVLWGDGNYSQTKVGDGGMWIITQTHSYTSDNCILVCIMHSQAVFRSER